MKPDLKETSNRISLKEKISELELELMQKNMQIARLEDELERSRLKNMEMTRLGEVAEKAKTKKGKGKK